MTRRRRTLLLFLAALALGLLAALVLMLPTTTITHTNAARVCPGMTRAEVWAILGTPRDELNHVANTADPDAVAESWVTEGLIINVRYDRQERVHQAQTMRIDQGSAWDRFSFRVRSILGL